MDLLAPTEMSVIITRIITLEVFLTLTFLQGATQDDFPNFDIDYPSPDIEIVHLDEIKNVLLESRFYYKRLRFDQSAKQPEDTYDIPKKIHIIWLGSLIPEKYIQNILSHRKYNPDYEITLWTDHEELVLMRNLCSIAVRDVRKLTMINRDYFERASNFGSKSDVLRYEIVYQEGGIYMDTDARSLKPLDENFSKSFVSYVFGFYKNLNCACFGFPRHSRFLFFLMKNIRTNFGPKSSKGYGPTLFTACYVAYEDNRINAIHQSYLIERSSKSYTYHSMDATWMKQEKIQNNSKAAAVLVVLLCVLVLCFVMQKYQHRLQRLSSCCFNTSRSNHGPNNNNVP